MIREVHGPGPIGSSQDSSYGRFWMVWLLAAIALGLFLRFYRIPTQILGGDELHAVRAALGWPLSKILTKYADADNCIPLTAFFHLVLRVGWRPSELFLRAPSLIAGGLLLVLIALWTRRVDGRFVAVSTTFLISVSPLLIFYSRLQRSYMPMVFLGVVSILAFESWLSTGSKKSGAIVAFASSLAAYFHLGVAPFVLAPLGFALIYKIVRRERATFSWIQWAGLTFASASLFLLFLVPARHSLLEMLASKHQPEAFDARVFPAVLKSLAGSGSTPVSLLFWSVAGLGLIVLLARSPERGLLQALAVTSQLLGLLIIAPLGLFQAPIFSRYCLVILPFVLYWIAVGTNSIRQVLGNWLPRWLTMVTAAVLPVVLLLFGPLTDASLRASSFTMRETGLLFYAPFKIPVTEPPDVYANLSSSNPGPVVEFPWHTTWRYSKVLSDYQQSHGRRVIVSPGERLLWDERLGFKNSVPLRAEDLLRSPAAYVILHLDMLAEVEERDWRKPRNQASSLGVDRRVRARDLERFAGEARRRVDLFQNQWGQPDISDDGVVIWDLNRIRDLSEIP